MDIKRINTYQDSRFSQKVLYQHGCFLVDALPYEIEIISEYEAIIRGENVSVYSDLIEEFHFYTPNISCFYDVDGTVVKEYPKKEILTISIDQIQPSQFYVDRDKINAISTFINKSEDSIIQVLPYNGRYISLDGHTRLYYAVMNGWDTICAVTETSDEWVYDFIEEAHKRNIYTPYDMMLVNHEEYEIKWNQFCDEFFERNK